MEIYYLNKVELPLELDTYSCAYKSVMGRGVTTAPTTTTVTTLKGTTIVCVGYDSAFDVTEEGTFLWLEDIVSNHLWASCDEYTDDNIQYYFNMAVLNMVNGFLNTGGY